MELVEHTVPPIAKTDYDNLMWHHPTDNYMESSSISTLCIMKSYKDNRGCTGTSVYVNRVGLIYFFKDCYQARTFSEGVSNILCPSGDWFVTTQFQ